MPPLPDDGTARRQVVFLVGQRGSVTSDEGSNVVLSLRKIGGSRECFGHNADSCSSMAFPEPSLQITLLRFLPRAPLASATYLGARPSSLLVAGLCILRPPRLQPVLVEMCCAGAQGSWRGGDQAFPGMWGRSGGQGARGRLPTKLFVERWRQARAGGALATCMFPMCVA